MPASQMGPCGNVPQWTLLGQEKGCVRGGGRQSDSCHCLGGHAHVRVCVRARAPQPGSPAVGVRAPG